MCMFSNSSGESRRSVLKKVAGGAAASAAFAGSATAMPTGIDVNSVKAPEDRITPDRVVTEITVTPDCDCETEFKCEDTCYKDGSKPQVYKRECCTCDNGTTCDNWTEDNQCCL